MCHYTSEPLIIRRCTFVLHESIGRLFSSASMGVMNGLYCCIVLASLRHQILGQALLLQYSRSFHSPYFPRRSRLLRLSNFPSTIKALPTPGAHFTYVR